MTLPGSNAAPPERYLEDASGFRGTAERLIVPADESELADALREANATQTPVTIAGAAPASPARAFRKAAG